MYSSVYTGNYQSPPSNHMSLSRFNALCCCVPLGLLALMYSKKVTIITSTVLMDYVFLINDLELFHNYQGLI